MTEEAYRRRFGPTFGKKNGISSLILLSSADMQRNLFFYRRTFEA